MERYAKLAIAFVWAFGFAGMWAIKAQDELVRSLAVYGMAAAATLWWICDAARRRSPVPYASLWIGMIWYINIPLHLISTRGTKGLLKLLWYGVLYCAVMGSFFLLVRPSVAPTQEDRELAAHYSVRPELIVQARLEGENLRPYKPERDTEHSGSLRGFMFDVQVRRWAPWKRCDRSFGRAKLRLPRVTETRSGMNSR